LKIENIQDQVDGVYPKILVDGDMDAGDWSCGMVVGLLNDIPMVKELIDRIMAGAEQIIRQGLTGFLDGVVARKPARAVWGSAKNRWGQSTPVRQRASTISVCCCKPEAISGARGHTLRARAGDPGKGIRAEHPDMSGSLNNLGGLLLVQGDFVGAWPLFQRALPIYDKALGPEHPYTATSLRKTG
jgi:Tetratricopeptide repeat